MARSALLPSRAGVHAGGARAAAGRPQVGAGERPPPRHALQRELLRRRGHLARTRGLRFDGPARDGRRRALPGRRHHHVALRRPRPARAVPVGENPRVREHADARHGRLRLRERPLRRVLPHARAPARSRLRAPRRGVGAGARQDRRHAGEQRLPAAVPVPDVPRQPPRARRRAPPEGRRNGEGVRFLLLPLQDALREGRRRAGGFPARDVDPPRGRPALGGRGDFALQGRGPPPPASGRDAPRLRGIFLRRQPRFAHGPGPLRRVRASDRGQQAVPGGLGDLRRRRRVRRRLHASSAASAAIRPARRPACSRRSCRSGSVRGSPRRRRAGRSPAPPSRRPS